MMRFIFGFLLALGFAFQPSVAATAGHPCDDEMSSKPCDDDGVASASTLLGEFVPEPAGHPCDDDLAGKPCDDDDLIS